MKNNAGTNTSEMTDAQRHALDRNTLLEAEAWKAAALRLGEQLSTVGPNGYYEFTPTEWLNWCESALAAAQPEAASPADRIAELEAKIERMRPSEEAAKAARCVIAGNYIQCPYKKLNLPCHYPNCKCRAKGRIP